MKIRQTSLAARALASVIIMCLMMTMVLGCQREVKPTGTITLYTSVPTAIIEELNKILRHKTQGYI